MSSKISITIGAYGPGKPITFTTRTIVYSDLLSAINTVTSMLTTQPLLSYLPERQPDPVPIVEENEPQ